MKLSVRRATLDDLKVLSALWESMGFEVEGLSRRVTEFQVVQESEGGSIVGTIALQMAERQGLIHSEAFSDFSLAEPARPLLWERLRNLANNYGLLRLWTSEQAPFWRQQGLVEATPEMLQALPAAWKTAPGRWLTLKLKEDVDALLAMDHELRLMLETERQRSRRTLQQARMLKVFATVLGVLIALFIVGASVMLMMRRGSLVPPGN